ncbi:MAG: hypothetical protein COA78_37560 [Blastopirellula sp.]|nr:MAG: hypothetical protein COA78_37560 [Blastopirellula sp.]
MRAGDDSAAQAYRIVIQQIMTTQHEALLRLRRPVCEQTGLPVFQQFLIETELHRSYLFLRAS